MKKMFGPGLLAATLAVPLHASADQVNWIDWNGKAGTIVQDGKTIDVTYEGAAGVSHADYFAGFPATFTSDEVSNSPGSNGFLQLAGGPSAEYHHIRFSSAVVNPYVTFLSLGANTDAATFTFEGVNDIDVVSKGNGPWGPGSLTVSGNIVSGKEGNGVVRLNGTFTDLYFTTPVYENWYGATVGAASVSPVPEPGTWGMLLAGGAVLALVGRRRNSGKFTQPA